MDKIHKCPYCGCDRNKNIDGAKKALHLRGVRSAMHDPGGVGIEMNDGTKLRIAGECNACDEKDIWRFLLNN